MTATKLVYQIGCWNDCLISGCPGHTIEIEANNTSNLLSYSKDSATVFSMDFDELAALIRSVHSMRYWVEIDELFRTSELQTAAEQLADDK